MYLAHTARVLTDLCLQQADPAKDTAGRGSMAPRAPAPQRRGRAARQSASAASNLAPRPTAAAAAAPSLPPWLLSHAHNMSTDQPQRRLGSGAMAPSDGAASAWAKQLHALRVATMAGIHAGRSRSDQPSPSSSLADLKAARSSRSWPASVRTGAGHSLYCNKIMTINETRPASVHELQLQSYLQARGPWVQPPPSGDQSASEGGASRMRCGTAVQVSAPVCDDTQEAPLPPPLAEQASQQVDPAVGATDGVPVRSAARAVHSR